MNLIEQLGWYKSLKKEYEETLPLVQNGYKSRSLEIIRKILLQYRREHGVYEHGDKVVCLHGQDSSFLTKDEIYTVEEVCYGGTHITLKLQENYDGGESSYSVNRFNHATDAAIEAKRRLNDEPKWGRAVELERLNQITITSTPSGEAPFFHHDLAEAKRNGVLTAWDFGRDITNE